jgi:hypothetical protein
VGTTLKPKKITSFQVSHYMSSSKVLNLRILHGGWNLHYSSQNSYTNEIIVGYKTPIVLVSKLKTCTNGILYIVIEYHVCDSIFRCKVFNKLYQIYFLGQNKRIIFLFCRFSKERSGPRYSNQLFYIYEYKLKKQIVYIISSQKITFHDG